MAKYYGKVGFAEIVETAPGVIAERIVERSYYGDVVRNIRRLQGAEQLNDNVTVSNELSIVADPYARENFHAIRYAQWMSTNWKVTSVEVEYPRLILSLGGVFNDNQVGTA